MSIYLGWLSIRLDSIKGFLDFRLQEQDWERYCCEGVFNYANIFLNSFFNGFTYEIRSFEVKSEHMKINTPHKNTCLKDTGRYQKTKNGLQK